MNFVERVVSYGGKLAPLVIPHGLTNGTGLMNPSVFVDDDGDILINLRHVNYTLYHAEGSQRFPSKWGPLAYLHPEKDQRLTTENYICRLNDKLEMTNFAKVEMLNLHQPIWEFVGLEDARLVKWNGTYYLVGVRRDTTVNGQGRMEYTEVDFDKTNFTVKEVSRYRIPAPDPDNSYCEKNWYPIIDKPYHFVKWSVPTEIVHAEPHGKTTQVSVKPVEFNGKDQRGSSQLIPWGDYHISIMHEVDLYKNYLNQKDAIYRHRFAVWSKDYEILGFTEPFSFLDAKIEFCVGLAQYGDDVLITFGFQDNAAFILQTPTYIIEEMISECLSKN
jgi:predicted GH43/DUF377 family glycosyl hydrolase